MLSKSPWALPETARTELFPEVLWGKVDLSERNPNHQTPGWMPQVVSLHILAVSQTGPNSLNSIFIITQRKEAELGRMMKNWCNRFHYLASLKLRTSCIPSILKVGACVIFMSVIPVFHATKFRVSSGHTDFTSKRQNGIYQTYLNSCS